MRARVAANMWMRGEGDAAWPLLEDALRESRQLGSRIGECQALGFLVQKAYADGDLTLAIELALESAAIAHEVGWAWWEAGQLHSAAELERESEHLDAAEGHAFRSLELSLGLGDRQHTLFAAAELAIIAAARRDAQRAGRLWGAVETEVRAGRVGQWEKHHEEIEALVMCADGPAFTHACAEGRLLSIAHAAGLDPAPAG